MTPTAPTAQHAPDDERVTRVMPHARWYAASGHGAGPIYDCVPADDLHALIALAQALIVWCKTPRPTDLEVPMPAADRAITEAYFAQSDIVRRLREGMS